MKIYEEDFALLQKTAEKHLPDAILTNAGIVLTLAQISARQILGRKKK